jgi:hypothetical protein
VSGPASLRRRNEDSQNLDDAARSSPNYSMQAGAAFVETDRDNFSMRLRPNISATDSKNFRRFF